MAVIEDFGSFYPVPIHYSNWANEWRVQEQYDFHPHKEHPGWAVYNNAYNFKHVCSTEVNAINLKNEMIRFVEEIKAKVLGV